MRPEHRPPGPLILGAEWLEDLPHGEGEFPPPGTWAQPVQEFHRRTVTGRTSGQDTRVVEWLYASIGTANINTGTRTNDNVRTWVQQEVGFRKDDAGHIIGNRLGGLGTVDWNIFPQSSNFNKGVYSQVEGMICRAAVNGNVRIWFRFYFEGDDPGRPTRFSYYIIFPEASIMSNDLLNPYMGMLMT